MVKTTSMLCVFLSGAAACAGERPWAIGLAPEASRSAETLIAVAPDWIATPSTIELTPRAWLAGADSPGVMVLSPAALTWTRGGAADDLTDIGSVSWAARVVDESIDLDFGESVRFNVGRTTSLRDGGIDAQGESLSEDRLYGFEQADGEFDLYDLSLHWDALRPGPMTFSLIGGFRAIKAEIGQNEHVYNESGAVVSSTFRDARGVTAVPVVGGGIRLDLGHMYLSGEAATHTLDNGATYLDVTAEGGINLRPNVGLFAGYQYIRSAIPVQDLDAELAQDGVFARLQIRF